ncbi:hypothetical protein [Streptomyces sp. NPDC059649]
MRARHGLTWTAQDMTEYAALLEVWMLAVRSEDAEDADVVVAEAA